MTHKAELIQNLIDPTTPGQVVNQFDFPIATEYLGDKCIILSEKKCIRIEKNEILNVAPFDEIRSCRIKEEDIEPMLAEFERIVREIRTVILMKKVSNN